MKVKNLKFELNPDWRLLVVSDLHLADWTGKDNFYQPGEKVLKNSISAFVKLIQFCLKAKVLLLINGDWLELWQTEAKKIWERYDSLLSLLARLYKKSKLIIIRGNHDWHAHRDKNFKEFIFYDYVLIKLGGKEIIRIEHGHRFDFINHRLKWLAHLLTDIWGLLECLGLHKLYHPSPRVNFKKALKIDAKINRWGKKHGLTMLCGHTHRELELAGYYNSGTLTSGKRSAVMIEAGEENNLEIKLLENYCNIV